MSEVTPVMWSDFDGTAVALVSKFDPRNSTKYPLPRMPGYADFLRGVQSTGVVMGGILTRRPDILPRRWATARSVNKLGYVDFFGPDQLIHVGSEEAKARFAVKQSEVSTVGLLEDKPHKLGAGLLSVLTEPTEHPGRLRHPLVVGVVAHEHSREYINRLYEQLDAVARQDILIEEFSGIGCQPSVIGFRLGAENLTLQVTPLGAYSHQGGAAYGQRLLDAA